MNRDYLRLALRNLAARRLRAWLTILGIVAGIAAVVSLLGITNGLNRTIQQDFKRVGVNTVMMIPKNMITTSPTYPDLLYELPQVGNVEFARIETARVASEGMDGEAYFLAIGISASWFEHFPGLMEVPLEAGRLFQPEETFVAVVNDHAATDLGIEIGDTIQLEETDFQVIGIGVRTGDEGAVVRGEVLVPLSALTHLYGDEQRMLLTVFEIKGGYDVKSTAAEIKEQFAETETPVTMLTVLESVEQTAASLGAFQQALVAIAAVALVVGALGVMTTMYTSVFERTRQIGIMKTIGAKRRHILWLFCTEAGLLGAIGGILGIALGIGISGIAGEFFGAEFAPGFSLFGSTEAEGGALAHFSPALIAGTLALSVGLGAFAGLFPAWRAARLKPIEALRSQ